MSDRDMTQELARALGHEATRLKRDRDALLAAAKIALALLDKQTEELRAAVVIPFFVEEGPVAKALRSAINQATGA